LAAEDHISRISKSCQFAVRLRPDGSRNRYKIHQEEKTMRTKKKRGLKKKRGKGSGSWLTPPPTLGKKPP